MNLTYEQASEMLNEQVANVNLRKHMYCVEACMRAYAKKFGQDEEKWAITGLLHDADYEKYPSEHPKVIVKQLREMGVDEEIAHAIASHGNLREGEEESRFEKRESQLDKVLFAVDELSGFVVACALVRPDHLEGLEAKSVKKKLKDKSFAAKVNRDDIYQGIEELGVDMDEHIDFVIMAIQGISDKLGL
jgi:putative nucleotidyltransferase with HDIG domain